MMMKRVLVFLWVFICFCSYGQRDSLVGKIWMGKSFQYLKFDTVNKQASFVYYIASGEFSPINYTYEITDSTFNLSGLGYWRHCELKITYKCFGDSLILKVANPGNCMYQAGYGDVAKPFALKAISNPKKEGFRRLVLLGGLEVILDSLGYFSIRNCDYFRKLRGDYTGKLKDTAFQSLKRQIEENDMHAASRRKFRQTHQRPIDYVLFYGDKVLEGNGGSWLVKYIGKAENQEELEFQNYLCGDSVAGIFIIEKREAHHCVSSGALEKIGSFKTRDVYYIFPDAERDETPEHKIGVNIYRFEIAKIYSQPKYKEPKLPVDVVYMLTDSLLNASDQSTLEFTNICMSCLGVDRKKPRVFAYVNQHSVPAEGDTVITLDPIHKFYSEKVAMQGGGFKLFGRYYNSPFKTDFEQAYKKYILKDWKDLQREVKNSNVPDGGLIPNKKNGYKYGHI